ncbi:hypothetical protein BDV59DRAFT_178278 [Aspergillus ambiguus]|uniref:uncharacterized protein n=1 Tax=Aspergillus ambiguus TaxID=176160 RepID=UPI003CCCDBB1
MALSFVDDSCSPPPSLGLLGDPPRPKQSMWHRLGLRRWLGRDDRDARSLSPPISNQSSRNDPPTNNPLTRRLSRKVGVGLPRSTTFQRQNSERRDNLSPLDPEPRRAVSADRRRSPSAQPSRSNPRLSAPDVVPWRASDETTTVDAPTEANEDPDRRSSEWNLFPDRTDVPDDPPPVEDTTLDMELEKRWILNLSMHFRDRSEREKFFVTYAETPNRWRRVTISCDYRAAPPDSLEQDLKELRYQRDKCARIYESIRESLPEIQFYDTVTNLKLETRDGRLHVHVTEDVNEIIPYPPISCVGHLTGAVCVPESSLHFEAHLSGFVYNVKRDGGGSYIKKEIPGPDTVDEFLYEINALHALRDNPNVVQVEGIVVDDDRQVVKGLLISYAEKGALVDILYEDRGTISWDRRERWARQIVEGLSEIHEAGYVQGDFTLSNIVVDASDHAKIIDINRRGCPVGWEPPEIAVKIESNQRISMYIGVKTDLYQLGMTLWALATEEDEPERQPRPLVLNHDLPVPDYYRRVVSICLSDVPQHRLSAKELLAFFPPHLLATECSWPLHTRHSSLGVGLHGGALPLYTPQIMTASAALLNSRTESGEAFGSLPNNQPPVDSDIGCNDDKLSVMDEDRIQSMDIVGPPIPEQPGNISIISAAPEESSIQHPIPCTLEPSESPYVSPEAEIDLDAGSDPHWKTLVSRTPDLTQYKVEPMYGDLAGVGGHPTCSLGRNTTSDLSPGSDKYDESPISSATTHSMEPNPADLGDTLIEHDWSDSLYDCSVPSLLHSELPINPAFTLLGRKSREGSGDRPPPLTIRSALRYPRHTPYLMESHLPINPAFTGKTMTSICHDPPVRTRPL